MTRDDGRQPRGLLDRLLRRKHDEPEVPTSGLFTARTVPVPPPDEPPAERLFDGVADAWAEPREAAAGEPETVEPETVEPETVEPETVEPEAVEPETVEPETVEREGDGSLTDLADELHRYVTESPTDDVWDEDDLPGARLPEEAPDDRPSGDNLFRAPTRTVRPTAPPEPAEVDDVLDVLDRGWPDDEPSWVDTATEPVWEDDTPAPPSVDASQEHAPQEPADDADLRGAAAAALWEHEEEDDGPGTAEPPADAASPAVEASPELEPAPEPEPEATEPAPQPESGSEVASPAPAPEPEPDVAQPAPEAPPELEPEVARVPIGEDPPVHGPKQIRVYDDRLDRRPGPIQMSPSEAVALAKDGRGALHRRTRRED